MAKKSKGKKLSRRVFVGQTGAAAGLLLTAGCKTLESKGESRGSSLKGSLPPSALSTVVTAKIHPGIGIARIGNSGAPDGFFIGPEVTEPELTRVGESRDAAGAIKRQAARFRIYGYDAAGKVVGELTADDATIAWSVRLANRKAQWYRFIAALDIPEAAALSSTRRNATIQDRSKLAVDPGSRQVQGKNVSGAAQRFDGGHFLESSVSLGELRTDEAGRLLVLSGLGKSGSPLESLVYNPNDADSFNNADGWYDDVADGPVTATVTIAGVDVPVEASWVAVAPPNYAPNVIGWRTMTDLLVDTYIEAGMMAFPEETSFTEHVLPVLRRLTNLQWVNRGFAAGFGHGSTFNFDDPAFLAKLAAKPAAGAADPNAALRHQIFNSFRVDSTPPTERKTWPWMYGDAFGSFGPSTRNNLALSATRTKHLQRWVDGHFASDWHPEQKPYRTLDKVPVAEQAAMLDHAALHFCLADAFHPGCELTWPMRHASLYQAPFRIKQRPANVAEPDYGPVLTQQIALSADGPLHAQGPGGLTRWMALPWQGDTAFCRSGYEPEVDPYILTFWPARVPNHVLTATDYAVAVDPAEPKAKRIAAFQNRRAWVRAMTGAAPSQMRQMIDGFGKMGIVEARDGVAGDADFPAIMFVESLPNLPAAVAAASFGGDGAAPHGLSLSGGSPPRAGAKSEGFGGAPGRADGAFAGHGDDTGWESAEQLAEFRKIRSRKQ